MTNKYLRNRRKIKETLCSDNITCTLWVLVLYWRIKKTESNRIYPRENTLKWLIVDFVTWINFWCRITRRSCVREKIELVDWRFVNKLSIINITYIIRHFNTNRQQLPTSCQQSSMEDFFYAQMHQIQISHSIVQMIFKKYLLEFISYLNHSIR